MADYIYSPLMPKTVGGNDCTTSASISMSGTKINQMLIGYILEIASKKYSVASMRSG